MTRATEELRIPVPAEVARAYRAADPARRATYEQAVAAKLLHLAEADRQIAAEEAIEALRAVGDEAQRSGMTRLDLQEILEIDDEEMQAIFGE